MQKICGNPWCNHPFEVTAQDLAFLESVAPMFAGKKELIPPPTLCPECRMQRKTPWRKERSLHRRTCDLCKQSKVSLFPHGQQGVQTYCPACYWSDRWDAFSYGQEFDPDRPFFDQFAELLGRCPQMMLQNMNAENSEYCHRIFSGKNNYLSYIAILGPENLIHTYYTITCKDCTDVTYCQHCELCYELTDAAHCYHCAFGRRLKNCNHCYFSEDCTGCAYCIRCKNLHQKQYCIENRQVTQMEFEEYQRGMHMDTWSGRMAGEAAARTFFLTLPHRNLFLIQCENVEGENLVSCKDSYHLFDFFEAERMRYCAQGEKSHDCMDCFGFGLAEHCYECVSYMGGNHNLFCVDCHGSSDCIYSDACTQNCSHCFGCIGLKHKQYCILNRQCTKDEYEALAARIVARLRQDNQWGEFFPVLLSLFAYNDTAAQDYFPIQRRDAEGRGWRWLDEQDETPKVDRIIDAAELPNALADVPDDVLDWAIECEVTGRPFKIIKQELDFYRKMNVPIPRSHPDVRLARRFSLRRPLKLWNRDCAKCRKPMVTSYAPEQPEIVYCEECYLNTVY